MNLPTPELVRPGVWWLHSTRGANVYLLEADDGSLALVDTGFPQSTPAILAQLAQLRRPLAAILITHRHFDHAGGAATLRRQTGARVVAGRGDCRPRDGRLELRTPVGRSHIARLLGSFLLPRPEPAPVDVAVEAQTEVLPGVLAIPTPGHTPGSLCFLVPRLNAAFVGDLVISHGGTLTRPLRMANADDHCYLQSLATFAAIAPQAGFPGHGAPVLDGFGEQLRQLAALPRRNGAAAFAPERLIRLASFARGFTRARRPRHPG